VERFCEALKRARERKYRSASDFSQSAGIKIRTYQCYEGGERVPAEAMLETILTKLGLPHEEAEQVRSLHRRALAEKSGVDLSKLETLIDVSGVSEKIVREVGYELKRYNVDLTPRMVRVLTRRVSMILDDSVRGK
jgi:transcriptional regulator with XRE-family HTH domain